MSEPGDIWGGDPNDKTKSTNSTIPKEEIWTSNIDHTMYKVDPTKIKTIDDVVRIIDALDIRISPIYHNFDKIEDLLKKEDDDNGMGR